VKAIEPTRRGPRREPVSVDALRFDEIWTHFKQAEESLLHVMIATGDLHFAISTARYRRDKRKGRIRR
jgi:hypothetical protein